jgi:hypothetical protein
MKNLLLNVFAITASAVFAVDNNKGSAARSTPDRETNPPVVSRDGKEVIYVSPDGKRLKPEEVRARMKDGARMDAHFDSDGEVRVVSPVGSDRE